MCFTKNEQIHHDQQKRHRVRPAKLQLNKHDLDASPDNWKKGVIISQFSIHFCGSLRLDIPNEYTETSDKPKTGLVPEANLLKECVCVVFLF